jgi:hypothetical protein
MSRGILLLTVLLSAACAAGINTSADWNQEANFVAFQTYAWTPVDPGDPGSPGIDQLTDTRIRAAIEANLNGKGLRLVPLERADLAVDYQVTTQDQTNYTTTSTGWGGGYGRYGRGWGGTSVAVGTSTTRATTYTNGTLVIGLFSPQSQEVLWHGSGTTKLRENPSPAERTETVNNAVAKILEQFPPSS